MMRYEMKKKCIECKKEFDTNFTLAKYCSDKCRVIGRRKKQYALQKRRYHEQMNSFRKTL